MLTTLATTLLILTLTSSRPDTGASDLSGDHMQDPIESMRSGLRREPTDANMENMEWLDKVLPQPRRLLDGLMQPKEAQPMQFPFIPGQPQQVAPAPEPPKPQKLRSVLIR